MRKHLINTKVLNSASFPTLFTQKESSESHLHLSYPFGRQLCPALVDCALGAVFWKSIGKGKISALDMSSIQIHDNIKHSKRAMKKTCDTR